MPAPRAYSEAEVIAKGLHLELSGPVTAASLHQALGGRGSRSTAFSTWLDFDEQRQRLGGLAPVAGREELSPQVSEQITQLLKIVEAVVETTRKETAAPHELKTGHFLEQISALLVRNDALATELEALRRQVKSLARSTDDDPAGEMPEGPGTGASLIIRPCDSGRRAPRERLGPWQHPAAPAMAPRGR